MSGASKTSAFPGNEMPGTDLQGTDLQGTGLHGALRQMLAVLEAERQALASMDLEAIMGCSRHKGVLCDRLEGCAAGMGGAIQPGMLDEECRGMLEAAQRLNEVNRQIRNLVAANVSARLEALTGQPALYRPRAGQGPAYGYTGVRA